MIENFKCIQCGECCELSDAIQGCATQEDMNRWYEAERYDILEWVSPIYSKDGSVFCYDIWISPKTHDWVYRCPWKRKLPNKDKYICRIHDVKPDLCREYPKDIDHAIRTGCKGIKK